MTLSHCVGLVAHFTWRRRKYTSRVYWCSRSSRPYTGILSTSLAIRTVLAHTERSLSRRTLPHRSSHTHAFCYHEDTELTRVARSRAGRSTVFRYCGRGYGRRALTVGNYGSGSRAQRAPLAGCVGRRLLGTRSSIRSHHQFVVLMRKAGTRKAGMRNKS